jgi:glycosyltransferase involved in cell wall biosynthesis
MKSFYNKFVEKLIQYYFKASRFFFRKFFNKLQFLRHENLREFLKTDSLVREEFIFRYGRQLFNSVHPKNIFNYRNEFFKENVNSADVVLDIGCGTGQILFKISPIIKKGIGIDYDENNQKVMKQNFDAENLEFIQGDMYAYDYKSLKTKEKYNVAIFSHLLEHVEDPVSLINKIDAEKVLVCVPSQEKWLSQLKKHLKLPYITDPTHYREYTRKMLVEQLVAAGYVIDYIGFNPEGEIVASAFKFSAERKSPDIRVSYAHVAHDQFAGGTWKVNELNKYFPERYSNFNILYLLSAAIPENPEKWIELCKSENIKIVLNQNGVHYSAWYKGDVDAANRNNKLILENADFVIYQSEFSKLGSDKFLSTRSKDYEIVYNAVDTQFYTPGAKVRPDAKINLLCTGLFYEKYRIVSILNTLSLLLTQDKNFHLLIGGDFLWSEGAKNEVNDLIRQHNLENHITMLGRYTKETSREIYNKADILVHTKYNDPCPTAIIEAMSCGLPIVYSKSGGVPELIGDSGVGVDIGLSWEENLDPESSLWVEAIHKTVGQRESLGNRARERAVKNFDIKKWIGHHEQIFKKLIK